MEPQSTMSLGQVLVHDGEKLYNIITHAYIPDEYVPYVLNSDVNARLARLHQRIW